MFGGQSAPGFGTPSTAPSLFSTPSSTPSLFSTPPSAPPFGTPSATPPFGTPSATPPFVTPSATPPFGTPSSTPAFGTPSSQSFSTGGFGSLFTTPSPFSVQTQQQQTPLNTGFGFQTQTSLFSTSSSQITSNNATPFLNPQLTTQMAPVAALHVSFADRDFQAIDEAYIEEPGNPKFQFKYLLFSVTDPQFRVKPAGVPDNMWSEAISKLEGMESSDRERLWPQLVQGFKDLSNRLKSLRLAISANCADFLN